MAANQWTADLLGARYQRRLRPRCCPRARIRVTARLSNLPSSFEQEEWLQRVGCRRSTIQWGPAVLAEVLSVDDRAVRLLDSANRPSVSGLIIPDNDSNCCTVDVRPSKSSPILHRTDLWFSASGNQVLHKTARFPPPLSIRFPTSDCK